VLFLRFWKQKTTTEEHIKLPRALTISVFRNMGNCSATIQGGVNVAGETGEQFTIAAESTVPDALERLHELIGPKGKILTSEFVFELSRRVTDDYAEVVDLFSHFLATHGGWTVFSGFMEMDVEVVSPFDKIVGGLHAA
jgi:hypothetical protein